MDKIVLPGFAHERHGAHRHPDIDLQKQHTADADLGHGFQVRDHFVTIHIAIHEIPVDPRARRFRWVTEGFGEFRTAQGARGKRKDDCGD